MSWFHNAKLALSLSMIAAASAQAGTVYTNFKSGTPIFYSAGPNETAGYYEAFPFTPSGAFTFTELDLGIVAYNTSYGATVYLADSAFGLPGSTLDSWSVSNLPHGSDYTPVVLPAATGGNPNPIALSSGSTYWVEVIPTAGSQVGWVVNSTSTSGPYADNTSNAGWVLHGSTTTGAMQVLGNATATPEPAVWQLAALGLAAVAVARRRSARV